MKVFWVKKYQFKTSRHKSLQKRSTSFLFYSDKYNIIAFFFFNSHKEHYINAHMKRLLTLFLIAIITIASFSSCTNNEESDPINDNESTLFIYMPWATNLSSYFLVNLKDIKTSIKENGLKNQKVVVYFATSATEACMYEIKLKKNTIIEDTIKKYKNNSYTTVSGISSILLDMKNCAPALKRYSMIIGSHGTGWIPINSSTRLSTNKSNDRKWHYDYEGKDMTRYFGGGSADCQTDISTLADAIKNSGLHMEFIMFDDCYMSNIEVAYELKEVTDHLIASTCEIMAYGMPYAEFGNALFGAPNYQKVCEKFYDFYSSYSRPCGTIAVTDCKEVDNMANIMKEINSQYTFDSSLTGTLQKLDGYSPVIFYDFGSYVSTLCKDDMLLAKFNHQLSKLVPYKANTPRFWSNLNKTETIINTFSGLTNSEATKDSRYSVDIKNTRWWKATH